MRKMKMSALLLVLMGATILPGCHGPVGPVHLFWGAVEHWVGEIFLDNLNPPATE